MADLFSKLKKGSILMWDVDQDQDLPKRKEIIRLLGIQNFAYYKSDGHHRSYIKSLARLKKCLSPDIRDAKHSYWMQIPTSHFLFTAHEIKSNSWLASKYFGKCLGSYFVDSASLQNLDELLRRFDRARNIVDDVKSWVQKVESHKLEITKHGIEDAVIENFQVSSLAALVDGYGEQAVEQATQKLQQWHQLHYWNNEITQEPSGALQEAVIAE